jgi:hypothetical protein
MHTERLVRQDSYPDVRIGVLTHEQVVNDDVNQEPPQGEP